jgi:hexosaminidase
MQASKLNVLHLHLTDSQSFPLLLDDVVISSNSNYFVPSSSNFTLKLSNLARNGAFSSEKVYSKSELIELVRFASLRGIQIVPEIDMPAHSLSWGKAFEDIIIMCSSTAKRAQTPWNIYPLDPSSNLTYIVVESILTQIASIFPSKYLHIGGDEINEQCWEENSNLTSWANQIGISPREITKYFEEKVFGIVFNLGKIPIVWQGLLDSHSMPKEKNYRNFSSTSLIKRYIRLRDRREVSLNENTEVFSELERNVLINRPIVEPWKCWGGALTLFLFPFLSLCFTFRFSIEGSQCCC